MAGPVDPEMLKDSTKTKGNTRSGSGSGSMPTKKITRVAVPRSGAEKVTAPAAKPQGRVTKQEKKGGMSVKTALAKATERWEQLADARKKLETEPAAKKTGGRFELSSTPIESLKSAKERRYRECLKEIETACAEQGISLSLKGLPGPSEIRIAIAGKQQATRASPAKHSSAVSAPKSAMAPSKNTSAGRQRGSTESSTAGRRNLNRTKESSFATKMTTGKVREKQIATAEKKSDQLAADRVLQNRLAEELVMIENMTVQQTGPCKTVREALDRVATGWSIYQQACQARDKSQGVLSANLLRTPMLRKAPKTPHGDFMDLTARKLISYHKVINEVEALCVTHGSSLQFRNEVSKAPRPKHIQMRLEKEAAVWEERERRQRFASRSAMLTTSSKVVAAAPARYGASESTTSKKRKNESIGDETSSAKRSKLSASAEDVLGEAERAVVMSSVHGKRKAEEDADSDSGRVKVQKTESARTELAKKKLKSAVRETKKASGTSRVQTTKRKNNRPVVHDPVAKQAKQDGKPPRGLHNHDQGCFCIGVLQVLDAAVNGRDLDTILGSLGDTEKYGAADDLVKRLKQGAKLKNLRHNDPEAKLRAGVKASTVDDAKQVRDHLHDVLNKLRDDGTPGAISSFLLQMAFAYGAAGTEAGSLSEREVLSGKTQEDCVEFYQKLQDVLCEGFDEMAEAWGSLFQVSTTTNDVCVNGCAQDTIPESVTSSDHDITVASSKDPSQDLQTLFDDSLKSVSEQTCTKCDKGQPLMKEKALTETNENLVVRVGRVGYDSATGHASKSTTKVVLPLAEGIRVGTQQYDIVATIMHNGKSGERGHYTVFRKVGQEWYFVNDDEVMCVEEKSVGDDTSAGHSAMLLLKRRQS
ncbi:hypothetical protein LTS10_011077 [Elasticomyces elasticus]|nr:hypothetical protein LTS10_011077 [Elasticomyces elasticus]